MENILVTNVGDAIGQGIIKCLKEENVSIFATDENPLAAGLYFKPVKKSFVISLENKEQYIQELLNLCIKEGIHILYPGSDREVYWISESKEMFIKNNIFPVVVDYFVANTAYDKWGTFEFCKNNGIGHPHTVLTEMGRKIISNTEFEDYPLIVKPRNGDSSKGVVKVNNSEDLESVMSKTKDMVVQEFIPGKEYTVGTYTSQENQIKGIIILEKEIYSGTSLRAKVIENKAIEERTIELIKLLGVTGPTNFQYKFSEKEPDNPLLFDINARFQGTSVFHAHCGLNAPLLALKEFRKESIESVEPTKGITMLRYWDELYLTNTILDKTREVSL